VEKGTHRGHDVSDGLWNKMESLLAGRGGKKGGRGTLGRHGRDNRSFINAVFWILRTGASWRNLPQDFGD
jgi:transposase